MEYNIRGPDGVLRQIVVHSSAEKLTLEGIGDVSFVKGKGPFYWMVGSNGQRQKVYCAKVGDSWWIHYEGRVVKADLIEPGSDGEEESDSGLCAPMPGTILEVLVAEGDRVSSGQTLLVMEAMKMEHRITAPYDAMVEAVNFATGDRCDLGAALISLEIIES